MHPVPKELQRPTDQVRKQKRAEIADVRKVIHRRTAAVHPHTIRLHRLEDVRGTSQGVKKANFHSADPDTLSIECFLAGPERPVSQPSQQKATSAAPEK
jgi:hypothetical protein